MLLSSDGHSDRLCCDLDVLSLERIESALNFLKTIFPAGQNPAGYTSIPGSCHQWPGQRFMGL